MANNPNDSEVLAKVKALVDGHDLSTAKELLVSLFQLLYPPGPEIEPDHCQWIS